MHKEELLQELTVKISTGEISRDEVMSRLNFTAPVAPPSTNEATKRFSRFSTMQVLYVIGAAIVIVGIVIFTAQVWEDIGLFGRILTTLVLGLLMAGIGSMLLKEKPDNNLGAIFHFIGGVLIPFGALVTLNELSSGSSSLWPVAMVFGVIFACYLLLHNAHRHPVLTCFAIANGTVFFYLFAMASIGETYYRYSNLPIYLTAIIGISYLLLAHAFRGTWNKILIGALHFLGISGFLGALFVRSLGSTPWQLFYFLILLGGLFLAAYIKSRSILAMSTLFLIIHIISVTGRHFAASLGWPLLLVLLGFIFIGLGYASVTINKRYIKNTG